MLRIHPTMYIVKKDYSPKFWKGKQVFIDAVKWQAGKTGLMLRVVWIWKRPQWFCSSWFKEVKK